MYDFSNAADNLKWFSKKTKPYHINFLLLVLIVLINSFISVYSTSYIRNSIDSALNKDYTSLVNNIIMIVITTICIFGLTTLISYYQKYTKNQIAYKLQGDMIHTLLNKQYHELTDNHSQYYLVAIINDTNRISTIMTNTIVAFGNFIFRLVLSIILTVRTAPSFMIWFALAPFILLPFLTLYRKLKEKEKEYRKTEIKKRSFFSNLISDLMLIKSYNSENIGMKNVNRLIEDEHNLSKDMLKLSTVKEGYSNFLHQFGYAFVIAFCAIEIFNNRISYGTSVMLLRLIQQIIAPTLQASTQLSNSYELSVSFEKVRELEAYPDENITYKDKDVIEDFYNNDFKSIIFDNVLFSYDDNQNKKQVLSNVNMTINKNESVFIKGMTGSGKSTIFKLLMNLYPLDSGQIYMTDNKKQRIKLDGSYRRLFAYVPQGNHFMNGTIKEVVTFFEKEEIDEEKVWNALKVACADDFVKELPDSLNTSLKEKGLGLSEGQLQRISIARAIYTDRPILLLDEATSALDTKTEKKLLRNIKALKNKTLIIAAHKPEALNICDKVYDIEKYQNKRKKKHE